jgi:hypothetical protein
LVDCFLEIGDPMSRALLEASTSGDLDKLQQHLAKGVDVDCIHKGTGRTPLIEAVISGHVAVANLLIKAGANVNRFDTAVGYSPLIWACAQGHHDLVTLLLAAAADVNARSPNFGWTPLLAAAKFGSLPIIQQLLTAGADLHASTTDGRTALAIARAAKKFEVAAALKGLGCRAECTIAAPRKLPWPAVDAKASNVDFSRPEAVVRGLIIAMNQFERNARRADSPATRLDMMNAVYDRFCTQKDRPYGRNGSYRTPPEYDPDAEYLIESKLVNQRRAEIITRNDDEGVEYLYVLLRKAGSWRVDSKQYRLVGGRWGRWSI